MDEDSWSEPENSKARLHSHQQQAREGAFKRSLQHRLKSNGGMMTDDNGSIEEVVRVTRKPKLACSNSVSKPSIFAHCDVLLTADGIDQLQTSCHRPDIRKHERQDHNDSNNQLGSEPSMQKDIWHSPFAAVDNYMNAKSIATDEACSHSVTQPAKPGQITSEPFTLVDTCIEEKNTAVPCVRKNVAPLFRHEHRQSNDLPMDYSPREEKPKQLRKRSGRLGKQVRSTMQIRKSEKKQKGSLPEVDVLLDEQQGTPQLNGVPSFPEKPCSVALRLPPLSEEQHKAVNMPFDKPLLVLAGPGSGKTLFLASRIAQAAWSISSGQTTCASQSCVAVTFTKRAASELQHRVGRLCACTTSKVPWVGTLHALALRLLREVGDAGPVAVATEADRRDIIGGALGAVPDLHLQTLPGLEERQGSDSDASIGQEYGRQKSRCDRVSRIAKMLKQMKHNPKQWISALEQNIALGAAQQSYNAELAKRSLIDVEDILPKASLMLKESLRAQDWAQNKVQNLFVDEWQDVDTEEANFLYLLCRGHAAITAVGDDDQQIYGWRRKSKGSTPAEEFRKLWPVAAILTLSMNFRSLPAIVSASSKLISHNIRREAKDFKATKEGSLESSPVRIVLKDSTMLEAQWIGEEIQSLRGKPGNAADNDVKHLRPWNSFAVLARTNAAIKIIEEQLLQIGLPTQPAQRSHRAPNKSPQGLALLAYMRLIIDEDHDASFLRVFNFPKRGLGKAALRCLRQVCRAPVQEPRGSPLEGIRKLDPIAVGAKASEQSPSSSGYMAAVRRLLQAPWAAPSRVTQGLVSFEKAISCGREVAKQAASAAEVGRAVLEVTGLLRTNADAENDSIIFERLLAEAAKYKPDDNLRNGAACVAQFLLDGAGASTEADCICVSTIHAAKGLEWDIVFVAQCCENVMPLQRTIANQDGDLESELEEERRLFYVAMTRAREQLVLTCGLRALNGQPTEPSRFLSEAGLIDTLSNEVDKVAQEHSKQTTATSVPVTVGSSRQPLARANRTNIDPAAYDNGDRNSLALSPAFLARHANPQLLADNSDFVAQMPNQTSQHGVAKAWRAADAALQVALAREACKENLSRELPKVHHDVTQTSITAETSTYGQYQQASGRDSVATTDTPSQSCFQSAKSVLHAQKNHLQYPSPRNPNIQQARQQYQHQLSQDATMFLDRGGQAWQSNANQGHSQMYVSQPIPNQQLQMQQQCQPQLSQDARMFLDRAGQSWQSNANQGHSQMYVSKPIPNQQPQIQQHCQRQMANDGMLHYMASHQGTQPSQNPGNQENSQLYVPKLPLDQHVQMRQQYQHQIAHDGNIFPNMTSRQGSQALQSEGNQENSHLYFSKAVSAQKFQTWQHYQLQTARDGTMLPNMARRQGAQASQSNFNQESSQLFPKSTIDHQPQTQQQYQNQFGRNCTSFPNVAGHQGAQAVAESAAAQRNAVPLAKDQMHTNHVWQTMSQHQRYSQLGEKQTMGSGSSSPPTHSTSASALVSSADAAEIALCLELFGNRVT